MQTQIRTPKLKLALLISTLCCSGMVFAQDIPPGGGGGAALRNIQENATPLPKPVDTPQVQEAPGSSNTQAFINALAGVDVNDSNFKESIATYWQPFMGKTVTNADVQKFKDWAWQEFRQAGYLGLVTVTKDASGKLIIRTSMPTVGAKKFVGAPALTAEYGARVQDALSGIQANQTIDLLDIEQRLYNLSYDLPIEVGLTLDPKANNAVDLIFEITPKGHNPGKFKYGALQLNNYGLPQYGRNQLLGSVNFEGFTPGSIANLTVQGAEGLIYGHAEYSAPTETLRGVGRVWVDGVNSKNINPGTTAARGVTTQYGVGLTNILGSQRAMVYQSNLELSQRHTKNSLQNGGFVTGNITDTQGRLRLSADNGILAKDNIAHYEMTLVSGGLTDVGLFNQAYGNLANGNYSFMTAGTSFQKNLTNDGWYAIAKARGQALPSRHLDTYNQFSLGGINGVRAYTTLDGVGDIGAVGSVEVRKAYNPHGDYAGLFYDAGIVQQNKNLALGYATYGLQATGLALGGTIKSTQDKQYNMLYNMSVAKAIGSYAAYTPNSYETKPNSWRFNFALTLPL